MVQNYSSCGGRIFELAAKKKIDYKFTNKLKYSAARIMYRHTLKFELQQQKNKIIPYGVPMVQPAAAYE